MRSFAHAFCGIATLVRTQPNAKVHVAAIVVVSAAGLALDVPPMEWCALALAMGGVLSAEALNTGIEFLCDAVHPEHHPLIGKAKDVAAAGVLIMALSATIVGLLIFVPRFS